MATFAPFNNEIKLSRSFTKLKKKQTHYKYKQSQQKPDAYYLWHCNTDQKIHK